MTKIRKPRYQLCNIITDDVNLVTRSEAIRQDGITHEAIYIKGLEAFEGKASE